jgi:aspartyl-tRNA(Asn)/glutamyl-tRNA(Gln) amidotransferase subunit A
VTDRESRAVAAADRARAAAAQPVWRLGARELAAAYAARELSPREALDAILARIEEVNPRLNAIVTLDRDGARSAATASERRWRDGKPFGPLDGVPFTVKDNIAVSRMRTTWGSRLFADHVPDRDELPVARLRAQGAVIVGKTNVPEFTLQGYTHNPLFGTTRNPWDLRLTPGGSSGGAVAAVAAGLGPAAIATDGGGSIRRPASHAGLVGFKPSAGRVARAEGLPVILHDFEVIGPIARTTADVALIFAAIAVPDPRDRASLAFSKVPDVALRDLPALRILYVPRFAGSPVDPEIAADVAEAARNFERLGNAVEEGEAPVDLGALDRIWSVIGPAGLAWLLRDKRSRREVVGQTLQQLAANGAALTASDYVDALDKVTLLRAHLADVFARFDVMLTPSAAALPWPADETHPATIDGKPVGPRGHAVFTAFANAGGLPGISIPCRPSAGGLPIGVQLVAGFGEDETLLRLAAQYERAHPWSHRWPPL